MLSPAREAGSPKASELAVFETPRRKPAGAIKPLTPRRTPAPTYYPPQQAEPPQASSPPGSQSPTSSGHPRGAGTSFWPTPSPRARRQQDPDAAAYLQKVLWLSQCTTLRNPPPAMADFLASFNLGVEPPAPVETPGCGDVNELQQRLRGILDAKVKPTRAEHISTMLELRAAAQFTLNLSGTEDEALEGLNNIEPSLGGVHSASVATDATGQPVRIVTASETLAAQPQYNPVLQTAVAKHIADAVGAMDGSAWGVRAVSRGSQGWTFKYICKESHQHWSRAHSKNPFKTVIGEYSHKELEPELARRPAFDCRGSITIAFSRDSRTITVQYDHTPIHKTVAQLSELFPPPARQLGPGAIAAQQKAPKKNGAEKRKRLRASTALLDENGNAVLDEEGNPVQAPKRKKPRASTAVLDEYGNPVLDEEGNPVTHPKKRRQPALDEDGNPIPPKKRKKKNKDDAPDGPVMPPDHPGASSMTTQSGAADIAQGVTGDAAGAKASPAAFFPVNVSPEESARRRELAKSMLSNAGVDPDTLTPDQFGIFANQSPDLQKESLAMLAKYGAERLRIVHPGNKDGSASASASSSGTPTQATRPTPSGPTTTKELVPQDSGSKKHSRKSTAANADGAVAGHVAGAQDQTETPSKTTGRSGGKSRVACYQCKQDRAKCPHEKPSCSECWNKGLTCEYPSPKPRSKKKSEPVVVEDEEGEEDEPSETPYYSNTHMPVADLLAPNVDTAPQTSQPPYYQSSGLVLPRPEMPQVSEQASSPGLVLPTGRVYDSTQNQLPQAPPQEVHAAAPTQSGRKGRSSTGGRQNLPTGKKNQGSPAVNSLQPPSWPAFNAQPSAAPAATISPTIQKQTGRQHSRGSSRGISSTGTGVREGLHQLSQAAVAQQSPVAATTATAQSQARKSPFQPADRSTNRSRQSQRAQSRTPHGQSQSPAGPPPLGHDTATRQAAADMTEMAGYNYGHLQGAGSSNDGSNNWNITYEPYSQQKGATNTSSYPSYDYSRNTTTAMSMPGQSSSTVAPSQLAHAGSWMGSQNRDNRQGDNVAFNGSSSMSPNANASANNRASMRNFNMRTAPSTQNQRHQQQSQNYESYPSQAQQQNQGQAANQQPGWYGINGMPDTNNNPRYDYQSWTGMH